MDIGWPKNREQLIQLIEDAVAAIPLIWYKKAFESLPTRWEECIKRHGAMTDYWIKKNDQ